MLQRRHFALSLAAASLLPGCATRAASTPTRFLGDSHSHYGMRIPGWGPHDVGKAMRESGTTLLAWAIVDDGPWLGLRPGGGVQQARTPKPGDLWRHFQVTVEQDDAKFARWGLRKVLVPADVDRALAGEPHVVLAVEAANFLEGDASRVAQAHAMGVRHMQVVHYIRSPLGDRQTDPPDNNGLSAAGRDTVVQCKRLGIVVDLAHCTRATADGALAAAGGVMMWSHSWISDKPYDWHSPAYLARALPLPLAREIAARGGAMGLWTVRVGGGDPRYPVRDLKSFADETLRMCDLVGPDHVCFGTDMEGAGSHPILADYDDLRRVADDLAQRGLPDATLHGVLIGNYARVLKQSMAEART
ncbi:MAG TPA: membrane dipeptidase [Ramlibacter sp.]